MYIKTSKNILNNNLIFEKLINIHCCTFDISKQHQTPHICLTDVLEDIDDKKNIEINLPKNFLTINSWI